MHTKKEILELRNAAWAESNPIELAGDAACILSKLNTKMIRSLLEKEPADPTPRDQYARKALEKILDLADEFQKEFALTASEKYGKEPQYGNN